MEPINVCSYFQAISSHTRGACAFPDFELRRIMGIVHFRGGPITPPRPIALAKIDQRRFKGAELGFVPIDSDTDQRWRKKYGLEIFFEEPKRGGRKKDLMRVIDQKGRPVSVQFYHRKKEMDKIVRTNPLSAETEAFY